MDSENKIRINQKCFSFYSRHKKFISLLNNGDTKKSIQNKMNMSKENFFIYQKKVQEDFYIYFPEVITISQSHLLINVSSFFNSILVKFAISCITRANPKFSSVKYIVDDSTYIIEKGIFSENKKLCSLRKVLDSYDSNIVPLDYISVKLHATLEDTKRLLQEPLREHFFTINEDVYNLRKTGLQNVISFYRNKKIVVSSFRLLVTLLSNGFGKRLKDVGVSNPEGLMLYLGNYQSDIIIQKYYREAIVSFFNKVDMMMKENSLQSFNLTYLYNNIDIGEVEKEDVPHILKVFSIYKKYKNELYYLTDFTGKMLSSKKLLRDFVLKNPSAKKQELETFLLSHGRIVKQSYFNLFS